VVAATENLADGVALMADVAAVFFHVENVPPRSISRETRWRIVSGVAQWARWGDEQPIRNACRRPLVMIAAAKRLPDGVGVTAYDTIIFFAFGAGRKQASGDGIRWTGT